MISKEELICKIEEARDKLNRSIDTEQDSGTVYKRSVELDQLIEQYIVAGYSGHSISRGDNELIRYRLIFFFFFGKLPCYFLTNVLKLIYKWWKVVQSGREWRKSGVNSLSDVQAGD